MSVFVVFQHCGHGCANFDLAEPETANKGRKDAEAAVQLAHELGQPAHTPIYFAIDFDPYPGKDCAMPAARIWPSIEAYFDQVNEVFAQTRWQVGIYGAGVTCRRLRASGKRQIFLAFDVARSCRHAGVLQRRRLALFQNVTEIKRSYAPDTFDTDVANPAADLLRAMDVTRARRCRTRSVESRRTILASRAFVKKGCVHWSTP